MIAEQQKTISFWKNYDDVYLENTKKLYSV